MTLLSITEHHRSILPTIIGRLQEFRNVPESEWFYELCYCLLTPQSQAIHAQAVIEILKADNFLEAGFDPVGVLGNREHYIRFHNVKAQRLMTLRQSWGTVESVLLHSKHACGAEARTARNALVHLVDGYGYKEASHALRNIGWRELAILDRHILRFMYAVGCIESIPSTLTPRVYLDLEGRFIDLAHSLSIDPDELDLVFWSMATGYVLK